jgi:hypothetical protein
MCELPEDIPMARDRYGHSDMGIFDFTKKQKVWNQPRTGPLIRSLYLRDQE